MYSQTANLRLFSLLFSLLTVSGMALFFNLYDPWRPVGPDQIACGGFEAEESCPEWTGWDNGQARLDPAGGFNKSGGVILSTAPKQHGRLKRSIQGVENFPALRVSVRASAAGVEPGPKSWHQPRADLLFLDNSNGKPLYHLTGNLFSLKEDSGWRHYTAVFPAPPDIRTAQLRFLNSGKAGTLRIDDVSVVPVTRKAAVLFFNGLFALLWLAALAGCSAVLHPWKTWSGRGALLCALIIIIGVVLPGKPMNDTIASTVNSLQKLRPGIEAARQKTAPSGPASIKKAVEAEEPHVRDVIQNTHKAGHFALFALLALFSMLRWAPAHKTALQILYVSGGLCLFAAATEVLQFVTLDRKPGLSDLSIDLAGILLAVSGTALLTLPARLRKKAGPA